MMIFTRRPVGTLRFILLLLLKCDDRFGFLEFVLVVFFGGLRHKLTFEVINSEFNSTKLQNIEFLDLVVLNLLIIKFELRICPDYS